MVLGRSETWQAHARSGPSLISSPAITHKNFEWLPAEHRYTVALALDLPIRWWHALLHLRGRTQRLEYPLQQARPHPSTSDHQRFLEQNQGALRLGWRESAR